MSKNNSSHLTPDSSQMVKDSRIYVAGHRGLVGSAIMRQLEEGGYDNIITRTHAELDLTDQNSVRDFFGREKPEYVFLCAAKVGGILANSEYPAEFIHQNLAIQTNVIHESYKAGVKRLLFLGSSCIYPRDCPQPMKEEYLLTGPLESTNRPYAVAKIAGIEMCWAYNRQYGTQYLAIMPTNLYGPGDNYDLETSHVLPAMIRKFHEAKVAAESHMSAVESVASDSPLLTPGSSQDNKVVLWGTGKPMREFLYSDDLGDAAAFLMNLPEDKFKTLLDTQSSDLNPEPSVSESSVPGPQSSGFNPPLVNIGVGKDITIKELAELVGEIVGYKGKIEWDDSKPDGTPRKLLDVGYIESVGWKAKTSLQDGIAMSYKDYLENLS
jgi:GDP-L-fucose synthase